jgi:hypothetical protein
MIRDDVYWFGVALSNVAPVFLLLFGAFRFWIGSTEVLAAYRHMKPRGDASTKLGPMAIFSRDHFDEHGLVHRRKAATCFVQGAVALALIFAIQLSRH